MKTGTLLAALGLAAAQTLQAAPLEPTGTYFRVLRDRGTQLYWFHKTAGSELSTNAQLTLGHRDLTHMTLLAGRMVPAAKWRPAGAMGDSTEVLGARIYANCAGIPVADRSADIEVDVGIMARVVKSIWFAPPLQTGTLLGKDVFADPWWPEKLQLDLGRPGEDRIDDVRRISVRQRVSLQPGEAKAIAVRVRRSSGTTLFDPGFVPADDALSSLTFTNRGTVCLHHMVERYGNYYEETECYQSGDKADLAPSPPNRGESSDSNVSKISIDGKAVAHFYKGRGQTGERDTLTETKDYDTTGRAFTWQAVRAPQYKSIRVEDNPSQTVTMRWRDIRRAMPAGSEVVAPRNTIEYSVVKDPQIARYTVDPALASQACQSASGVVERWLNPAEYQAHRDARRLIPPPRQGIQPNEWHSP